MFSVTRQIVSTTTLAITVTLLLTKIGLAQRPAPPSLVVTPSTSIAFSGPQGGPFSPRSVEYRVRASSGSVKYSIVGTFQLMNGLGEFCHSIHFHTSIFA